MRNVSMRLGQAIATGGLIAAGLFYVHADDARNEAAVASRNAQLALKVGDYAVASDYQGNVEKADGRVIDNLDRAIGSLGVVIALEVGMIASSYAVRRPQQQRETTGSVSSPSAPERAA